ncbi:MAG: hypothetical protein IIY85_02270 [Lachnospiraceae bacterium]|nr:hypothetical protein [Lachnospiraceae bacterium]
MIRRALEGVWTLYEYNSADHRYPATVPDITVRAAESCDGGSYEIFLESSRFVPFVELDFEDADAVFSDNYFSMVKKSPYHVTVKKCDILRGRFADASDVKRRLRIRSLRDTY